ncbi:GAF domain-containing protein [Mycobacterium sp.]|uniref:sensor histidine kinase n=1 Tax=Mycobacterium sp. TaxID=1785 RepID=UPI0025E95F70|nr:GAF domain-containing protein [Mycobacterium sp.]
MVDGEFHTSRAGCGKHAPAARDSPGIEALLADHDQTQRLLRGIVEAGSEHDLESTLGRVIAAGIAMTGCRYGALAMRDSAGKLTSFTHSITDPGLAASIGAASTGKGVLGAVFNRETPVRLNNVRSDPPSSGSPERSPQMGALLGVPIKIRGNLSGGLYLIDDRPDWSFTEADETAVQLFASAAAMAIDNAQLFEHSKRRADWLAASRGIITELLLGTGSMHRPLQLIAEQVRDLADAEQAIVLTPSSAEQPADEIDRLVVSAAVGTHADEVVGQEVPVDRSTTGQVFRSGAPLITESFRYPIQAFTDAGQRSAIVMPLRYERTVKGVIAVARGRDQAPFDGSYLDLVGDFASQAALALALATNSESARELSILADRERIAHDLHDYVIQRLFAIGLDVQGTIARARNPDLVARLNRTIDELQTTIEEIRATIFQLQSNPAGDPSLQRRLQDAVAHLTENRDIVTALRISGPLTAIEPALAQEAEAVVVEAVSNAVRHSGATHLTVEATVADELSITVVDDGCGIPADNQRQSGLTNMRRRAERVGGVCRITSPSTGGTTVRWTAPITDL